MAANIIFELNDIGNKNYQVSIIYNGQNLSNFLFDNFSKTMLSKYIEKIDYITNCNKS